MGNEIFIKDKEACVKPLRERLEAIQRLQPPTTVKGCRSFVGMVNFMSMFCPDLQRLLQLIYDLTRKGRPFAWGKEQQDSFKETKCRLIPPQFYTCQMLPVDYICIQIPANLQQEVHYTKFIMVSPN